MSLSETQDQAILPLSQDAALVAALAGTAVAFAHSREDEAERWLRALRLHGHVGSALQALGVGEAPLMTRAEPPPSGPTAPDPDIAQDVVERADQLAASRGVPCVGTIDLLFALFEVYGGLIDRALYLRGASREELVERLADMGQPSEAGIRP